MSLERYQRGIRSAARGLWTGSLDYDGFFESMVATIDAGIQRAFLEGAAECGFATLDELSDDERTEIQRIATGERQYIDGFAEFIEANGKADGGKLATIFTRADMWINRYRDTVNRAKVMACGDKKLVWNLGPTEEHCPDCAAYNGRVYRASVWERYEIRPQDQCLACHGFRCLCRLDPTDARANPGRPPRKTGC